MDMVSAVRPEDNGSSTLAFPSISTSDFQFDHAKASSVLVEAVAKFLMHEDPKMRLVLVDLTNSHMLSLVSRKAREKGVDSKRFLTFVGDITKLRSSNGPGCNIIANAANWRLKAGGGGVNAAIYSAAGPDLERATKKVAQTLNPGTSVAVQLPESSPLYMNEGVTHVIHVLGPNMNPQRPNFLSGDYSEGCRILQSAYASLFLHFSSIVRSSSRGDGSNKDESSGEVIEGTQPKPSQNAFAVLMQGSKRNRDLKDANPKRDKVRAREEVVARTGNQQGGTNNGKRWDGWALALHKIAMHPEQHKDVVLQTTEDAVVLRDMYPKAKRHVLVVARRPGLDSLENVQREHLPVLRHMHSLGEEWAARFLQEDPSLICRVGYHSIPSMRQVHLHVISQDFDSASLKNKKHWNSFTTPFFLDSLDVLDWLEKQGQVQISQKDAEILHDLELRCHRCRSAQPNIPSLKQHISKCRRPLANSSFLITAESLGL
ncbi:unnamed protein product [Calypogeia fissa]